MTSSAKKFLIILPLTAALCCAQAAVAGDPMFNPSGSAVDMSALPTIQHEGNITFVTGGIGDEERDALSAVGSDYNLHILSSGVSGAFVGDTSLTIRKRGGDELLTTDAGPIFFASLPPGHYVIEAQHGDQTRRQDVTVGNGGTQHVHISWR